MKILVVDDHALIRTALRGVLGELGSGVTVLEASDCRGAFGLIEAQPDLDLVLLDLNLPGMHGLAALQELRARHPSLPVVVLSSANDRASVMQALDHEQHQDRIGPVRADARERRSNMPRLGANRHLTPEQIAHLVAFLIDPQSPINRKQ